jgi:F-box-like
MCSSEISVFLDELYFVSCRSDDVLPEIFSHLDVEDFISCKEVCVNWQRVLLKKWIWIFAFERKVNRFIFCFYSSD